MFSDPRLVAATTVCDRKVTDLWIGLDGRAQTTQPVVVR
jgi:hypothetical protein